MSNKRRNDTNVKYVKSENVSLVTGGQVKQFYDTEDRNSEKVERCRLFRNNPSPQHHFRYIPESRAYKSKRKKSNYCCLKLKSKNKKLIAYCLIYLIMFTCAITLLYLFYTPKQMNLFGFYSNNNLRLKFYRFVLGKNATTITPKIITTTEPTIFISPSTTSKSISSSTRIKTKPFIVTESPMTKKSSTTPKPIKSTTVNLFDPERSMDVLTSTSSPFETDEKRDYTELLDLAKNDDKIDHTTELNKAIKFSTTCITMNVTESTQSSVIDKIQTTTTTLKPATLSTTISSTKQSPKPTPKSKTIEILKKTTTSTTTTELPTTILPRDNSTETIEFKEKFSYSNNQLNSLNKNETVDEEAIVDNGILPTEEEEEERKKDEAASKQIEKTFFGLDAKTGKEKQNPLITDKEQAKNKQLNLDSNNDLMMNKFFSNIEATNQKSTNNWFLSKGNQQQFRNRDQTNSKQTKEDDEFFKYHPMLKLLYKNCFGECSNV